MKKILFFVLICVSFYSCKKDYDDSSIIGHWIDVDDNTSFIEFKKNNRFITQDPESKGKFTLSDDNLSMYFDYFKDTPFRSTISFIGKDNLTIYNMKLGGDMKLKRR